MLLEVRNVAVFQKRPCEVRSDWSRHQDSPPQQGKKRQREKEGVQDNGQRRPAEDKEEEEVKEMKAEGVETLAWDVKAVFGGLLRESRRV